MSFFSRILDAFRRPIRYVGRDLEGNRFYEHPSSTDDPRRTKRTVKYSDPEAVWQYIGRGKRLPVQWSAWLTHTRQHPPTIEELEEDLQRQERVLVAAKLIEAREAEERRRAQSAVDAPFLPSDCTLAWNASSSSDVPVTSTVKQVRGQEPAGDKETQEPENSSQVLPPPNEPKPQKSPWITNTNPEPESWIPRTQRRGT